MGREGVMERGRQKEGERKEGREREREIELLYKDATQRRAQDKLGTLHNYNT